MALQIQKNSRQIPSIQRYTADDQYNDLLYGYLQSISYVDLDKNRYIDAKDIKWGPLGKRLNVCAPTIKKRFNNLLNLGFIEPVEKKNKKGEIKIVAYRLVILESSIATLVPFDTLCLLIDGLSTNSISLFVYLLNRYIANKEQEFTPTMSQMKNFIGVASSTTSNNDIIVNIFVILKKLGLIEYRLETQLDEYGKEKSIYHIIKVNNVIERE